MNPKTDEQGASGQPTESEFSPAFLRWLITLTLATLFFVFVADTFHHSYDLDDIRLGPFPWVYAGGMTISHGLSEFSGKDPQPLTSAQRYSVLASLLIVFVVGPTLFFFGWRQRKMAKESGEPRSRLLAATAMFIVGGILTFTVVVPAIPAGIAQRMVSQSMKKAQAISSNKDDIINELNTVKSRAYQYWILPTSLGGGGGTYEGFQIPPELASTEDAMYEIVSSSQDKIRIKATSKLYPESAVSTTVNQLGHMYEWEYGGLFR